MSLASSTVRRIAKELAQLRSCPPEGCRVVESLDDDDITQFMAWVAGPEGTPYAGGYFKIRFAFGDTYPSQPPKCTMVTKIFHPNVSKQGEICVDTLKKGWTPETGISHILSVVRCLLIYPNPESALDEEAGKLLLEAYEDYCKHARLFTSIHATPKNPPAEFASTEPVKPLSTSSSQAASPVLPLGSNFTQQPSSSTVASAPTTAPTKAALQSGVEKKPAAKAGGTKRGLKRL